MSVDVVVLAGGQAEPALARSAGTGPGHRAKRGPARCPRALIPFQGKPFIAWVLEALRGCAAVERIAVVGPVELRDTEAASLADLLVPEREGLFENFGAGVAALGNTRRVLVTASDNPLLTAEALDDFLTRC